MRRAAAISLGLDASMRPRHKAAENDWQWIGDAPIGTASMRPRHKAAENLALPDKSLANNLSLQ